MKHIRIKLHSTLHVLNMFNIRNSRNSCFIDSCLVAVFQATTTNSQSWVDKYIWKCDLASIHLGHPYLQDVARECWMELQTLFDQRDPARPRHATELRRLFQRFDKLCKPQETIDWTCEQNDPVVVIDALYRVFEIPDTIRLLYGNDSYTTGRILSPIINLAEKTVVATTSNFILQSDTFCSVNSDPKIISASGFVGVYFARNTGHAKVCLPVVLCTTLKTCIAEELAVHSLITHFGNHYSGHYVCYVRENGSWVCYDGMRSCAVREAPVGDVCIAFYKQIYD